MSIDKLLNILNASELIKKLKRSEISEKKVIMLTKYLKT